MSDSDRQPKTDETKAAFAPAFLEAQERNTTIIARANEVMVDTARAVWESEVKLFQLESEQVAKAIQPVKFGDDPASAVSVYCEQWQERSEKLLDHMRTVNDLIRKCGWDMFRVYQGGLQDAAKRSR